MISDDDLRIADACIQEFTSKIEKEQIEDKDPGAVTRIDYSGLFRETYADSLANLFQNRGAYITGYHQ